MIAFLILVTELTDFTCFLSLGNKLFEFINASELDSDVWIRAHLLCRLSEHIADILLLDIHFQRIVVLVDDDTLGPSTVDVGLEVGIAGIGCRARSTEQSVSAASEEENGQSDDNESVKPVHVEPRHLWLIVVALGIVVVVHFSD